MHIVYYELPQLDEIVTANRYQKKLVQLRNQLGVKRPEWASRHDKLILLDNDARPHFTESVKEDKEFKWDVLTHPPYLPVIAPWNYHLFLSMVQDLVERCF